MRKKLEKAGPIDRDWKGDDLDPGQDYVEVDGKKYGVLTGGFYCSPDGGDFRRDRYVEIGGDKYKVMDDPTGMEPEYEYIELPED
jgi:hypothetical protein